MGDGHSPSHKKVGALGRFMSFLRKGKDKEPHISNKRGISARQKSTDSGISSNRDTYINSDENVNDRHEHHHHHNQHQHQHQHHDGRRISSSYKDRTSYDYTRDSHRDMDHNHRRSCNAIKVVRNNSSIAYSNSSSHHRNDHNRNDRNNYAYNSSANKRTMSTLGARKGNRPNINIKRSNTSIGNGNPMLSRLNKHNVGHTSDSSTSSTGYISDHRNRNNMNNPRDNARDNKKISNNNNSNYQKNNNNNNDDHHHTSQASSS